MALKTKYKYDKEYKSLITNRIDLFPNFNHTLPEINMINGNFLEKDWSNGSMIFINSTCFSKTFMNKIFDKANFLNKGAIFVNTSHEMPKKFLINWQQVTPFLRLMSWGVGKIFIYRKRI